MQMNNKLLPNPKYQTIQHSSSTSNGWVDYFEYGNLVVANIQDLTTTTDLTNGAELFKGLPKPKQNVFFLIFRHVSNQTNSTTCRVRIDTDGAIKIHYGTLYTGNSQYYGTIIYIKA